MKLKMTHVSNESIFLLSLSKYLLIGNAVYSGNLEGDSQLTQDWLLCPSLRNLHQVSKCVHVLALVWPGQAVTGLLLS